jgi:uncharacterized protein (DUF488 family)
MSHQQQSEHCFTIGHWNTPIDLFIDTVRSAGIDTIIDVRSSPYSRFNPHFNRENLEKSLRERDMDYRFMGDRLGGRYTDPGLLFPDGTVNYRKVQDTEHFREGISRLLAVISHGKTIALMCAEKEPERCHRFLLIAPVLEEAGVRVVHVRGDGTLQDHAVLPDPHLVRSKLISRGNRWIVQEKKSP